MQVKTILIPIDFSEYCKLALNYAVGLAHRFDAKLQLLHVAEVHSQGFYSQFTEMEPLADFRNRRLVQIDHDLDELKLQLPVSFNLRIETIMKQGYAAAEIVDTATRDEVDLIVLSAPRVKFRPRYFLSGIADQIIRSANCPVLTVLRPRDHDLGASTPLQHDVKKILVASDLADSSFRAVDSALAFATTEHPQLEVLHVKRGLTSAVPQDVQKIATKSMQRGVDPFLNNHVDVKYLVQPGRPSLAILASSRKSQSDLIVMYTHGRHGFQHAMHHNVCEKVLSQADCPVLTIRGDR